MIISCFFWCNMSEEIRQLMQNCDKYQQMNAKFVSTQFLCNPKLSIIEFFSTSLLYLLMQTIYVCIHACTHGCMCSIHASWDRPDQALTQTKEGSEYFVSLMDYFSKWPEADPIPGQDTCWSGSLSLQALLQVGLISCLQRNMIVCSHAVTMNIVYMYA